MMLAGVFDVFQPPQRNVGIDEVGIVENKLIPLKVSRHRNGPISQAINGGVDLIGFALQNACQCIVSFLDLSDYNGL